MSRTRFRSQPTLQRSRGPGVPVWAVGLVVAVVGAGGIALIAHEAHSPAPDETPPPVPAPVVAQAATPAPAAKPAAPASVPVVRAAARPVATTETPTDAADAPPQAAAAPAPRPVQVASARTVEAKADPRKAVYDRAMDAYRAEERAAGFRWARQNNLTETSYCRATGEQRTQAFMQGCLSYLSQAGVRRSDDGDG